MRSSFRSVLLLAAAVAVGGVRPARADEQVGQPQGAPAAPAAPVAPAAPAASGAPARRLTMAGAIEVALSQNPQLAIEGENIVAAEAKATADSKLRLPMLSVRANALLWDRPIV